MFAIKRAIFFLQNHINTIFHNPGNHIINISNQIVLLLWSL